MFEEHHDGDHGEEEGIGTRLGRAVDAVAAVVDGLEPERLNGGDAQILTKLFARGERLCAAGKALTARRVAATGAWRDSGARNAADWLGRTAGTTAGQAAATLATSRAMAELPDVEAAVRAGELSGAQAAEIASAAKDAPGEAASLVDRAKSTVTCSRLGTAAHGESRRPGARGGADPGRRSGAGSTGTDVVSGDTPDVAGQLLLSTGDDPGPSAGPEAGGIEGGEPLVANVLRWSVRRGWWWLMVGRGPLVPRRA
jgi:hypothetical protein